MPTLYNAAPEPHELAAVHAMLPARLHRYIRPGRLVQVLRHQGSDGIEHTTLVLPEEGLALDSWPIATARPAKPLPPVYDGPPLPVNADSETLEVAHWCASAGLVATVAGQWVWVPDNVVNRAKAGGEVDDPDKLRALMAAAGFGWSSKRQSFFHKCTVEPSGKSHGGKLERKFNTTSATEYKAGFDPRPAWLQKKTRKKGDN